MVEHAHRKLNALCAFILVALLTLMVIDVTWQVITRFLLKNPSSYTEEIARFLLIWIALLGASYAHSRQAHLGVDILLNKLTGQAKRLLSASSHLITLFFAASIMVYGGVYLVALTFELAQVSASLGIPMGYIYLAIPISGSIICFNSMYFILQALNERNTSNE